MMILLLCMLKVMLWNILVWVSFVIDSIGVLILVFFFGKRVVMLWLIILCMILLTVMLFVLCEVMKVLLCIIVMLL